MLNDHADSWVLSPEVCRLTSFASFLHDSEAADLSATCWVKLPFDCKHCLLDQLKNHISTLEKTPCLPIAAPRLT